MNDMLCFIHLAKTRSRLSYYKSRFVYSYLLSAAKYEVKPNYMLCFILHFLTLGDGNAIGTPLIIPYGAGGHIEKTFKAVPSPYVHYDNLLSAIPDSGSLPSSPVATILFLHQLAQ